MKTCLLLSLILIPIFSFSQTDDLERQTKAIEEEGKRLYELEMASWHGTDLFLAKYPNRENIGGYFSYTENHVSKCLFFAKGSLPKVIGTISFDSTYNTETATADLSERAFTPNEKDLLEIRQTALSIAQTDTIFKTYANTNLNFIPLIHNQEKKVYILTGPEKSGVVLFGNDYLLTFNAENKLVTKKQLHKNLIPIYYESKEPEGKTAELSVHSHLPETGDFITATDICTLMLYEKFAKWKQHTVVSANYISFWNCQTDELVILTKDAVDKINKHQEKQRKKE
jgi:hypothetical protein